MNSIRVAPIVDKLRKNRLKRLWYILRREKTEAVKQVKGIYVEEKKGKRRPNKRGDIIETNIRWAGVSEKYVWDRVLQKLRTKAVNSK